MPIELRLWTPGTRGNPPENVRYVRSAKRRDGAVAVFVCSVLGVRVFSCTLFTIHPCGKLQWYSGVSEGLGLPLTVDRRIRITNSEEVQIVGGLTGADLTFHLWEPGRRTYPEDGFVLRLHSDLSLAVSYRDRPDDPDWFICELTSEGLQLYSGLTPDLGFQLDQHQRIQVAF